MFKIWCHTLIFLESIRCLVWKSWNQYRFTGNLWSRSTLSKIPSLLETSDILWSVAPCDGSETNFGWEKKKNYWLVRNHFLSIFVPDFKSLIFKSYAGARVLNRSLSTGKQYNIVHYYHCSGLWAFEWYTFVAQQGKWNGKERTMHFTSLAITSVSEHFSQQKNL